MTDDIIFGKNAITEALISGNREINKNEFITQIAKLERVKQINEI